MPPLDPALELMASSRPQPITDGGHLVVRLFG
jgi:hypothetical protein